MTEIDAKEAKNDVDHIYAVEAIASLISLEALDANEIVRHKYDTFDMEVTDAERVRDAREAMPLPRL